MLMLHRIRLGLIAALAVISTGCASSQVAVIPTPWAVVSYQRFAAEPGREMSANAREIESARYGGLTSQAETAGPQVAAVTGPTPAN
jgi:hypothetical protein